MRKYVSRIVCYSTALFLVALIADIIITSKLKETDCFDNKVWNRIFKSELDNDILIIGSSRAWVHYDTRIIDSALHANSYNLGRDGKHIDISAFVYQMYRKYGNRKPRILLVDVFDRTLATDGPYNRELFFPYLFNSDVWDEIHRTHGLTIFDRYVPMLKYYRHIKESTSKIHSDYVTYKGYCGFDAEWNGSILSGVDSIQFLYDPAAASIMDSLLLSCKNDGVNVVLVHSPIYYKYSELLYDSLRMRMIYNEYAREYNIPFLDYSREKICYDTNFFYNAMHLNRMGAETFTRMLVHDLDSMGYGNRGKE